MFSLRVMSLNVRGMANPETRAQLFLLLRQWPVDVYCLQEVRAPADTTTWSVQWGGAACWTKHTAILFNRSFGTPTFDVLEKGRVQWTPVYSPTLLAYMKNLKSGDYRPR